MEEKEAPTRVVDGLVKWFDPVKGFGFIVSEGAGSDILLHANVLRNFGQSSIADGAAISVLVQQTQRGVQAVEVLSVSPPEISGFIIEESEDSSERLDMETLEMFPARVKWFDKGKGFGFANVFSRSEDVFIHIEVLRASGFADLAAGEAICLRIIDGKRGRMAAQVLSWEAAVRKSK